jgi:TonB-dependent receptor
VLNSGDENLAQFQDLHIDYRPYHGVYPAGPIPSPDAMRTHKDQNLSQWQDDVAFSSMVRLTGRQDLSETVYAGYLMGNVRIDRLSILAGLRFEQTEVEGEGALNQITAEERARRAAFTGPLTPDEIIRRNLAQYGSRRTASRDYRNVFPGVHFKYEPLNRVVLRASYSASIGRPLFTNLIPNDTIDEDNRIVTANNPGLKPQHSDNFDATAEYYFEPAGLLSMGVFLKEIKDYIYNTSGQLISSGADNGFEGQYAGYELRSKANGGFARIKGWEANYQQRFAFLPGWWNGFGLFANYTWLDTKGDYGGSTVQTTSTLPGFVPRAANVGISYIRDKINFRVIYGFNGKALQAYNAAVNLRRWKLPTHRIDIKLKYLLTRNLDIYLDLYNVTNDKLRYVWGVYDRPQNILDRNDPQIHAGINGRF